MKIFLAVGNHDLEETLREGAYEIVDIIDELDVLADLLDYMVVDGIILNRLLDSDGERLIHIAQKAVAKGIRIIMLIDDSENYEERKLIASLVNQGVTAFVYLSEIRVETIKELLEDYPKEFDFSMLAAANNKKEKSLLNLHKGAYISQLTKGFKRIVAVASFEQTGKSYVAANLAYTLAKEGIETTLVDADFPKRSQSYYFHIAYEQKRNGLKECLEAEYITAMKPYTYSLLEDKLHILTNQKYDEELDEVSLKVDEEKFMQLLDFLRTENELVIVDTPSQLNSVSKRILSMVDTVFFVQNLDYRMMEKNKMMLNKLEKMNISLKKLVLVVNQHIGEKDWSRDVFRAYFNRDFAGEVYIPQDYKTAVKSIRYGKPAVSFKECQTVEAFQSLGEFCYKVEKITKKKKFFGIF